MVTITKSGIADALKTSEYHMKEFNTPKKFETAVNRAYKAFMKTYDKPLVKTMEIHIKWNKNKTVARYPSAEVIITFVNGDKVIYKDKISESGVNIDIELIERILNACAIQNILHKRITPGLQLSGVVWRSRMSFPYYKVNDRNGKFFNFNITHLSSERMSDKYIIKFT